MLVVQQDAVVSFRIGPDDWSNRRKPHSDTRAHVDASQLTNPQACRAHQPDLPVERPRSRHPFFEGVSDHEDSGCPDLARHARRHRQEDRLLARGTGRAVLHVQGRGRRVDARVAEGGQPPLDPKSNDPTAQTDATRRFDADAAAKAELASTRKLADVSVDDYDAVPLPGRPWPAMGSRRGSAFDRPDRARTGGRQAGRGGVPRAGRAASREEPADRRIGRARQA